MKAAEAKRLTEEAAEETNRVALLSADIHSFVRETADAAAEGGSGMPAGLLSLRSRQLLARIGSEEQTLRDLSKDCAALLTTDETDASMQEQLRITQTVIAQQNVVLTDLRENLRALADDLAHLEEAREEADSMKDAELLERLRAGLRS